MAVHVHVHKKTVDAGGKVQKDAVDSAIRKAEDILRVLKSSKVLEMEKDDFREAVKGLTSAYNWLT